MDRDASAAHSILRRAFIVISPECRAAAESVAAATMDGHAAAAHASASGAHTTAAAFEAATTAHMHAAATATAAASTTAAAATIAFQRECGRCGEGQRADKGDGCDCLFEHSATPDPVRPYPSTPPRAFRSIRRRHIEGQKRGKCLATVKRNRGPRGPIKVPRGHGHICRQ